MARQAAVLMAVGVAFVGAAPGIQVRLTDRDFTVERLAAVRDGHAPHLEAVRHSAYGDGVVAGLVDKGFLVLTRYSGTETAEFARIGPFNERAELVTMRFDTTGQFGNQLLLSVAHDDGSGTDNVVSEIVAVDAKGGVKRLASIGSAADPVTLNLEICDGSRGYPSGLYLQDRDLRGGSPLYLLDKSLDLSVLQADLLPPGRTDIDIRGMEFDPTGLYSSNLFLSDSDDHDRVSGIYVLDQRLRWTELTRLEPISSMFFGELAFSPGGALDLSLYVLERVGERVMRVSPTGDMETFATGFHGIESIAISAGGEVMYVSDHQGLYRIRRAGAAASL